MSDSENQEDAGLLTVPNLVTLVRLLCIPVFLVLLFGAENQVAAAILLGAVGATDWIDGYLARRLDQVSEIGKILDPVADRILFFVAVIAMIVDGSVPLGFALAVLFRETVVSGVVLTLGAMGARRIDVIWWGKAGTFGLMVAFPLFLLSAGDTQRSEFWEVAAWGVGIPSLVISYYAAFAYLPSARRALRDGRAARHKPQAPQEVESETVGPDGATPHHGIG